jgi:hypothetical protein
MFTAYPHFSSNMKKHLRSQHKNMIFRNNNLIKNVVFTGMVLLFTAFGYLVRRKNLAPG